MQKRKEIDKQVFERLCTIACTEKEICSVFGVSTPTLLKFCKREYNGQTFKEVYPNLSAESRVNLRKAQFESAQRGDENMLIWLGKQWLGQH